MVTEIRQCVLEGLSIEHIRIHMQINSRITMVAKLVDHLEQAQQEGEIT